MPSLISKNLIRFDAKDFLAGLYAQYQTSISANPNVINDQLIYASNFNPYRALGYAAPGFNPTDTTTVSVMTGLGRNVAIASESATPYAYILCNNDQLNRLVISTKTFSNAGSWPHSITGVGTKTGDDCVTYNIGVASVRTSSVLYSWNDSGGAWNVGIFNTAAGTFDDDFMTTVPATPLSASGNNKPHPMVVGADDVLYIGDGNKLHAYDGAVGASGTFYDSVLTLPANFIIKSFAKNSDYLIIFGYYSTIGNSVATDSNASQSAAFFYNYIDLDPTLVVPIPGGAVTAAFEYKGTVGCFMQGAIPVQNGAEDRNGTLLLWNGSIFEQAQQYIGTSPIHGGVDVVGNSIQWLARASSTPFVFSWGAPLLGAPDGLNIIATGGGTTSYGLLRTIGGTSGYQILSSGTTTAGGCQYMKVTTFAATANLQTGAIAPVFIPGTIGKVKRVTVNYSTTASGGRTLSVYLVRDNGQTTQLTSGTSTITNSTLTAQFDTDISGAEMPEFRELSLSLQWAAGAGETSAPIVRYVDVEFEPKNLY